MHAATMSFKSWFAEKTAAAFGRGALARARKTFRETTLPLISPRKGRRILRREQLFAIVRESLIRGGVLSTSYSFKVLNTDPNGDSFLVLIDLALGPRDLADEYLLEIERWIQQSAQARHQMAVRSVYWRRRPPSDQVGTALRAAMVAQSRREAERGLSSPMPLSSSPMPLHSAPQPLTAIPRPPVSARSGPPQAVSEDEVAAFRRALQATPAPAYPSPEQARQSMPPMTDGTSDFAALSETQYGKL